MCVWFLVALTAESVIPAANNLQETLYKPGLDSTSCRYVRCDTTASPCAKIWNFHCAPTVAERKVHYKNAQSIQKQRYGQRESVRNCLSVDTILFLIVLCIFVATLITDYRVGNTIYSLVSASTAWSITLRVAHAAKTMLSKYTVVLVINVCPRRACQLPTLNENHVSL